MSTTTSRSPILGLHYIKRTEYEKGDIVKIEYKIIVSSFDSNGGTHREVWSSDWIEGAPTWAHITAFTAATARINGLQGPFQDEEMI